MAAQGFNPRPAREGRAARVIKADGQLDIVSILAQPVRAGRREDGAALPEALRDVSILAQPVRAGRPVRYISPLARAQFQSSPSP